MKRIVPPYPSNIDKRRTNFDINGKKRHFTVLGEIILELTKPFRRLIYLQRLRFEHNGSIELRLGYYMLGVKPRMRNRWVWGQYATMIPPKDFRTLIKKAEKMKWF